MGKEGPGKGSAGLNSWFVKSIIFKTAITILLELLVTRRVINDFNKTKNHILRTWEVLIISN